MLAFTNTFCIHADKLIFVVSFFFGSLSLADTHTLRSSMVGSDTKLMPCHTGCQQISQWITPQPLDVHRAKGHKHGRGRERSREENEVECKTGSEIAYSGLGGYVGKSKG